MPTEQTFPGVRGEIATYIWDTENPRFIAVIAHGYGEHARRYDHVADALVEAGGAVVALDHHGHGRSEGERASVSDPQDFVADLDTLVAQARERHPGVPIVLIGHSMGGLIATRYAQQHADKLGALVLSAPVIGRNEGIAQLLALDPIPEVPIDPSVLSRDAAVGEAYAADELVYHGPFRRETLESLFAAVEQVAIDGPISLPTLWIHGEGDALAPLDVTTPAAQAIGSAGWQTKVYPGAMHEVFNETNRDEVIGDVVRFIDDTLASRS